MNTPVTTAVRARLKPNNIVCPFHFHTDVSNNFETASQRWTFYVPLLSPRISLARDIPEWWEKFERKICPANARRGMIRHLRLTENKERGVVSQRVTGSTISLEPSPNRPPWPGPFVL